MKKLMLPFFLCLFCTLATLGQNNVEIILSNGKTVDGATKTLFTVDDGDVIIVKDAKSGEKSEYKSTDIKRVKYYDSKSKEWQTFVPMMAQRMLPTVWNKNPKPYKTPVFLTPLYEGKNVSAYLHQISTITNTKNKQIIGTNYVFYFKVHKEDVAKAFWMGNSIGAKLMLKIVFKPYPIMKEAVSNLNTKEFDKDPVSIIKTFDELLK